MHPSLNETDSLDVPHPTFPAQGERICGQLEHTRCFTCSGTEAARGARRRNMPAHAGRQRLRSEGPAPENEMLLTVDLDFVLDFSQVEAGSNMRQTRQRGKHACHTTCQRGRRTREQALAEGAGVPRTFASTFASTKDLDGTKSRHTHAAEHACIRTG